MKGKEEMEVDRKDEKETWVNVGRRREGENERIRKKERLKGEKRKEKEENEIRSDEKTER